MAGLDELLDTLKGQSTALDNAPQPPTPAQLASVSERFVEVGQQLASAEACLSAEDVHKVLLDVLEGLSGALEVLRRTRIAMSEPSDEKRVVAVEVEAQGGPGTPEEEEGFNPFAGPIFRTTSPRVKRQRFPSPRPQLNLDPLPAPRLFPNPFNLSLADFPAVPIPHELLDPATGAPVFAGGFKRQAQGKLKDELVHRGYSTWNEIGGGNSETYLDSVRTLCLQPHWNMLPLRPGNPLAGIMSQSYKSIPDGQATSVFGKVGKAWHYFGEYVKAGYFEPTGAQLGALEEEEKEKWVRFWGRHLQVELRKGKLSTAEVEELGRDEFERRVGAGEGKGLHFAVYRCSGFDVVKMKEMVEKRTVRLDAEAEVERRRAENEKKAAGKPPRGKRGAAPQAGTKSDKRRL